MAIIVPTVESIGDEALTNSIIDRSITEIQDSLTEKIGRYAFYRCEALTKAVFGSVTQFINVDEYSSPFFVCLSIRNCIKRAPKSTVPGQHRFGFEKPCFCSL